MLYFANWKVLLICGACLLGVLLSLPNLFTPAQLAYLPHFIPKTQVALARDLRGGSYLLLHVDVDAITFTIRDTDRIEEAKRDLVKSDSDLVVEIAPDGAGTMKFGTVATE